MGEIYRGAVEFEDTAHYRFTLDGKRRYAPWISFLDLKITWNINTFSVVSCLYVKPIVLKLAVGIDTRNSDTDCAAMSMVYASETIRFYNACSRYQDFVYHCVRYLMQFLQKKYPLHLLMWGFMKVWKSGRHDTTKYSASLLMWREDILLDIPQQYQRPFKRTLNNGTSSHTILPNKKSCVHQLTPKPFVKQTTTTVTDDEKSAGFHPAPDSAMVRRQRSARRTKNKKRHLEFVYAQMNKRYGSKTIISKPTWLRDAVTGGGFGY